MSGPATDKEIDLATTVAQLRDQIESAHNVLDSLGIPRGAYATVWTVRGRLDWLSDRTVASAHADTSQEQPCLTRRAVWNKHHPTIGPDRPD